jgi:hypothetical protein
MAIGDAGLKAVCKLNVPLYRATCDEYKPRTDRDIRVFVLEPR